ncbi:hypothetical protein GNI_072910 [Gregarina niphandrodes]|uniref:Transmembrane protein n=1 Tax=Gregarina niphandrodes TaxID=110365 RepID=A0A023B725_GRENI|nr:hypothetical protein GNI_072910 [Gregarina niphandrodes]EZG66983.1 hypothetical protein GNI_072910 [Gregarina niphandrodes]|eukprot:XP_011130370.1 hypothetical protein GNI_072910 [Gregarina niphandrodes]
MRWRWISLLLHSTVGQPADSESADSESATSLVIPQFGFRVDPNIIDRIPPEEETRNVSELTKIACEKTAQVLASATCGHWILNKRYVDGEYYVDGSHCEEDEVPIEVQCLGTIQHSQHYNRNRKELIGQKTIGNKFIQLDDFMIMCPSIQRLPTTIPERLTAETVQGICLHSEGCKAITCTNKSPGLKKVLNAMTCWTCDSKRFL